MPQQQPSRQPIRVPQPPPPSSQPQQAVAPVVTLRQAQTVVQQPSVQPSQMSYSELVQLAERQRRQMDTNRAQVRLIFPQRI